ncbi:hypothetical protein OCU04_002384 [Sclerotinia nivalis]|uniref:Uncharacterized protein n=1 Tax=Sclerotinia nivalis TaxID=352851 RepID=A0A9X0DNI5_9HELO|nr:hypothetical protein OCU04_002384 [Sclerotinia nivalis]
MGGGGEEMNQHSRDERRESEDNTLQRQQVETIRRAGAQEQRAGAQVRRHAGLDDATRKRTGLQGRVEPSSSRTFDAVFAEDSENHPSTPIQVGDGQLSSDMTRLTSPVHVGKRKVVALASSRGLSSSVARKRQSMRIRQQKSITASSSDGLDRGNSSSSVIPNGVIKSNPLLLRLHGGTWAVRAAASIQ